MTTTDVASIILASVAVLGSLAGMAGVMYRMGQIVGRIQAIVEQRGADLVRLDGAIASVAAAQASHENWHRGPYRGSG